MMDKYILSVKRFFASKRGRRFWHFCYNWGAAVVLIGAMFKILHFPYANEILMVAMSVEALIFFLSAFDFEEDSEGITGISPSSPKLSQQIDHLTEFIQSINNVSGDIEKHAFNYGSQIQQMNRNLQELNALYLELLNNFREKRESGDIHSEDDILI